MKRPAAPGWSRGVVAGRRRDVTDENRPAHSFVDPVTRPTGRVFRRSIVADPPVAVEAHGSTISDADGRSIWTRPAGRSSSTSGTAGNRSRRRWPSQAGRLAYAHGSAFTTEPLEAYAREVAAVLPMDGPAIYPVSGGSEAIETALKLARAYHLARGHSERGRCSRGGGAITATRWAPLTSRDDGRSAGPTRGGWAGSAMCRRRTHTARATRARPRWMTGASWPTSWTPRSRAAGPGTVAAFVAEPIVGATLGGGRAAGRLLAGHRRGLRAATASSSSRTRS